MAGDPFPPKSWVDEMGVPHVGRPTPAARPLAKPAQSEHRRRLPHLQRPGATLAVTFATKNRWNLPPTARGVALECCIFHHGTKMTLHAAVVMPDHVHLLLTPGRDLEGNFYGLTEIISSIKSVSARRINQLLRRSGSVWQDERFDHLLRSNERRRAHAEYICENPVRAGLVADVDEYAWLWREWIEGQQ